jgi:hypothetical protein
MRKETSDCRAAGFVARAIPTGMLTKPKLMDPFQIVFIRFSGARLQPGFGVISADYRIVVGCRKFAEAGTIPPVKSER